MPIPARSLRGRTLAELPQQFRNIAFGIVRRAFEEDSAGASPLPRHQTRQALHGQSAAAPWQDASMAQLESYLCDAEPTLSAIIENL